MDNLAGTIRGINRHVAAFEVAAPGRADLIALTLGRAQGYVVVVVLPPRAITAGVGVAEECFARVADKEIRRNAIALPGVIVLVALHDRQYAFAFADRIFRNR